MVHAPRDRRSRQIGVGVQGRRHRRAEKQYRAIAHRSQRDRKKIWAFFVFQNAFSDESPTDDSGKVSTTTPYLVGRVKGVTFSESATDYWRISFIFEVSG